MKNKKEQPPRMSWETAQYQDDPFKLGKINDASLKEVSKDFLPSPDELVFKRPTKKITLLLDTDSINFFKREAARLNTSYQSMIRMLIQKYVTHTKQA